MPRTKSTKSNQSNNKLLFPPHLRNKKIDPRTWEHCKYCLEEYLKTEDPEYLLQAIKIDFRILVDEGDALILESIPIDYENELIELHENYEFVNHHTIVWSAIRYWRHIYYMEYGRKKNLKSLLADDAEKLLKRIGAVLVPIVHGGYTYRDGLMHRIQGMKLTYIFAKDFINRYEKINKFFDKKKIRKFRNDELEITENKKQLLELIIDMGEVKEEDREKFILKIYPDIYKIKSNPRTKTFEFISFVHSHLCERCNNKRPSLKTIENLHNRAQEDLTT